MLNRRLFSRGLLAAPIIASPVIVSALPVASPASPDAPLLAAEREWASALAAGAEARARSRAAHVAFNAMIAPTPLDLVVSDADQDHANAIKQFRLGRRFAWAHFDTAHVDNLEGEEVHARIWRLETLRQTIDGVPAALGRAGTTPHLIRRWRGLLPSAEAYEARVRAALAHTRVAELDAETIAARMRVKATVEQIAALPVSTAAGLGVKARVWTGREHGDFGTMWEMQIPAPLQAIVDAALAIGAAPGSQHPQG